MTTGTLIANLEGTIQTASQTNITAVGTLTGLSTSGNISLADNGEVRVGTGNDLVIKHDGSNSFINDTGTGDLRITGSQVRILSDAINLTNSANSEDYITCVADGAVNLRYDGTSCLTTTSGGGITVHGDLASSGSGLIAGTDSAYAHGDADDLIVGAPATYANRGISIVSGSSMFAKTFVIDLPDLPASSIFFIVRFAFL